MKYRKLPVEISATQWFKNGDHPLDESTIVQSEVPFQSEGKIVRRYRHPETPGTNKCMYCDEYMHIHGWIDTLEGGHIVCPGDWIITGVAGEVYPCKPKIFEATYEPVTPQVTNLD